jgi:YidC/Oxa1 family membrane protein insertase
LFVKQIKAQRTMQLMQPKIKELKDKYKNDKQKMNEEMIKLQREHGNPLLGCLPIVVQIPLFLALFRVTSGLAPKGGMLTAEQIKASVNGYYPTHLDGLSVSTASQIAHAKIFGASVASSLTSSQHSLAQLGSNGTATKVLCVILILIMMSTTFLTQQQIMGRQPAGSDSQTQTVQKALLYLSPLFLGVFGFRFSVGVLLYWFTTNLWSMGQQFFVIRRMPPVVMAGAPAPPPTPPIRFSLKKKPEVPPTGPPEQRLVQQRPAQQRPVPQRPVVEGPISAPNGTAPAGAQPARPPQRRKKSSRRGGRR